MISSNNNNNSQIVPKNSTNITTDTDTNTNINAKTNITSQKTNPSSTRNSSSSIKKKLRKFIPPDRIKIRIVTSIPELPEADYQPSMSLPGVRSRDVYLDLNKLLSNSSINATKTKISRIRQFFDAGLFKSLTNNSMPSGNLKENYESIINNNIRKTLNTIFQSGNSITLLGKKYVIADYYWRDSDYKQGLKRSTFEEMVYNVTPQMKQVKSSDLPPDILKLGSQVSSTGPLNPDAIYYDKAGKIVDIGQMDFRVPKNKSETITEIAADDEHLYDDMVKLKMLDPTKLDDYVYVRKQLNIPNAYDEDVEKQMTRYKKFLKSNEANEKFDRLIRLRKRRLKYIKSLLKGQYVKEPKIRKYKLYNYYKTGDTGKFDEILDMLEGKVKTKKLVMKPDEDIENDEDNDEDFENGEDFENDDDQNEYVEDDSIENDDDENEEEFYRRQSSMIDARGGADSRSRPRFTFSNRQISERERNRRNGRNFYSQRYPYSRRYNRYSYRDPYSRGRYGRQSRSSHGRVQSINASNFSIYITVELYLQRGDVLTSKALGKISCNRSWNEISRNFGILMGQEPRHYMLPVYDESTESIAKRKSDLQRRQLEYKRRSQLYGNERIYNSSRNYPPRRGGNKTTRKSKHVKTRKNIIIQTNKNKTYKLKSKNVSH